MLPCPICGKHPKLSSLEPEHKSMKYFCGMHISCGDWKETDELAKREWNKRVRKNEDWLRKVNTPGTPEFIYAQGILTSRAYCEDCKYETDYMYFKDLVFKVSLEGGYIQCDKEGGYHSRCPECGSEKLILEFN